MGIEEGFWRYGGLRIFVGPVPGGQVVGNGFLDEASQVKELRVCVRKIRGVTAVGAVAVHREIIVTESGCRI